MQATYERIRNVQNDLLHKFTTDLYRKYDTIVIEDLDVKGMQMQKKAKNLHRSLFGRFRQFMEYKAEKWGKLPTLCGYGNVTVDEREKNR